MANTSGYIQKAGLICPAPMTRAALITMRNASGLNKDCDYVITDHVQGRLVAGTTIHLQAVNANTLSENVQVLTTYDNEAWRGIYDIDRGLVLELQDNRNNVARGINGVEVTNFDWGNANITNTLVDNATWTSTYGSPRSVSNVKITNNGTLVTTGMVGGILQDIEIFRSTVDTTNANVSLVSMRIQHSSTFNLNGYTGGGLLHGYRLNNGVINFSGSSSAVSLNVVTITGSTLNHSGVSTGGLSGSNLIMENNSTITHSAGASNMALNRVLVSNTSQITHSSGVLSLTDYEVKENSTISQTGTGSTTLNSGRMIGFSSVNNPSAYIINGNRYNSMSVGQVRTALGAAGTLALTDTLIAQNGLVNITASSTAGDVTISGSTIGKSSVVSKSGTGVLSVTDSNINQVSTVSVTGSRSLTLVRQNLTGNSTINQTGAGAVSDTITSSNIQSRSIVTLSAGGAVANTLLYCELSRSSFLNIGGTSSGQSVQRFNIETSTININNNAVSNTLLAVKCTEMSTIDIINMTVAKSIQNLDVINGSAITINNPTGAGAITYIKTDSDESGVNIIGTAGLSNQLFARNSGIITHNGGNAVRIIKEMAGTLTTGAFNHNNVTVINPITQTLTAANTNRSSYLGVASTSPLI